MPTAPRGRRRPKRPHETEEHRTRRRGPRRATESFAEALARAEDPSPPELRAAEVGDAAGTRDRRSPPCRGSACCRYGPRRRRARREDGRSIRCRRAALPATPEPARAGSRRRPGRTRGRGGAEARWSRGRGPEPGAPDRGAGRSGPRPYEPSEARPNRAADRVPVVEGADLGAEPVTWDTDRYTAAIEEPDWYEAEAEADERAAASEAEPEPTATTDAAPVFAPEDATSVAPEETLLWLQGDRASAPTLPGSGELESALEALGATGPATSEVADAVSPKRLPEPAAARRAPRRRASAEPATGATLRAAVPPGRADRPDRSGLPKAAPHLPGLGRALPTYDPATALIVVDFQNDFADPAGSLAVSGAEEIIPVVNAALWDAADGGAHVVATQDWHPPSTPHFATDGGIWPVHCVADTWGAELHPAFSLPSTRPGSARGRTARMATQASRCATPSGGRGFDGARQAPARPRHRVGRRLRLATDYCVRATALDAVRLGSWSSCWAAGSRRSTSSRETASARSTRCAPRASSSPTLRPDGERAQGGRRRRVRRPRRGRSRSGRPS